MIEALRLSIENITYDNVQIALPTEVEDIGFDPPLGHHTIMFRYQGNWHCCHSWNLKLIHLSRGRLSLPRLIPFKRLVIDSDKIYGPGMFATNKMLAEYGVNEYWERAIESQVAFSCQEGIFITTDYAISNLIFMPGQPPRDPDGVKRQSITGTGIRDFIRRPGCRPCRSR